MKCGEKHMAHQTFDERQPQSLPFVGFSMVHVIPPSFRKLQKSHMCMYKQLACSTRVLSFALMLGCLCQVSGSVSLALEHVPQGVPNAPQSHCIG